MLVPLALKKKKKKKGHKRSGASSTTLRANFCPHWEAEKERGGGEAGWGRGGGSTSRRVDEVSLNEKSHRRSVVGRKVASTNCRRTNSRIDKVSERK